MKKEIKRNNEHNKEHSTRRSTERIGILGGTFDPPHNAHIALARAACKQCKLDKLIVMCAGVPVYKLDQKITPAKKRLEMCKLAFENLWEDGLDSAWGAEDVCAPRESSAPHGNAATYHDSVSASHGNAATHYERDSARCDGDTAHRTHHNINTNTHIEISDAEITRGGKTYTAQTLLELHEKHPDAQLYFIAGEDAAKTIPKWRDAQTIAKLATIVVAKRRNVENAQCASSTVTQANSSPSPKNFHPSEKSDETSVALQKLNDNFRVIFLDASIPNISSTQIRENVCTGQDISNALPQKVEEYIRKEVLYL